MGLPGPHAAMLLGMVGQGAIAGPAHWFPRIPFWPRGKEVGGYGGEEYAEPTSCCVGNMERI